MHYFFSWTKFLLWLFIIEYFDIIWHLTFQNIFFSQNQKHFNECFIFFFNRSQGHTLKGLGQFLKENEQCGIAVWLLAHLSFSDHRLSDYKLSTFSSFLPKHYTNINKTWHKATLGEEDSSLFKWRATHFPKER